MATSTLGTAATTTLTAVPFSASAQSLAPADLATIVNSILNDQNPAHPLMPTAFSYMGLLYVPNRGVLQVLPGDFVGVDGNGWPILVSKNSAAGASWVHT